MNSIKPTYYMSMRDYGCSLVLMLLVGLEVYVIIQDYVAVI